MSIVDKLLKLDAEKLSKKQQKEIEIPRLTELLEEPFIVCCQAIDGRRYFELVTSATNDDGKIDDSKVYDANELVAMEGIIVPDLKNEELQKHFGCYTPKELLEKLFNGGEITKIADMVTDLSGYGKESDKEIKNSSTRTAK